jgi:hypothetical protein
MEPGEHEAVWRPGGVAEGVYFCTLEVGNAGGTVMLTVRGR